MSKVCIELSPEDILELESLAKILDIDPSIDADGFCKKAKELSKLIPIHIKEVLFEFHKHGNENGFLLIRSLPIDLGVVPDTPQNNSCKIGKTTTLAKIQAILVSYISEIIAYEAECDGQIFQDIVPVKSMSNLQTSVGSNIDLEIHTEQAFSKLKPDILSLACLRRDADAITYILPVKRIINGLSNEEKELVRQPLWKTGVDLSFKINGHEFLEGDVRGPLPIINENGGDPLLTFDQDLMSGITPESDALLSKIVDIYYKCRLEHCMTPGDIVLIDNNRAVHGRSRFFPKYDGKDRFLVRCFGIYDSAYSKTSYARNKDGRVIFAKYS
jgi:L-asparagine oxygenase